MFGFAGNNFLEGGENNDYLYGDVGDDTLLGDAGDDILLGSIGNDTLTGGAGADQFSFFSISEGIDKIEDFKWYEGDKISIYAYGFGATSTDQFNYNNDTGALSFNGTQLASLQPNLGDGFIRDYDINLF